MTSNTPYLNIPTDQDNAEYLLLTQGKMVMMGEINEQSYAKLFGNLLLLDAIGSPDVELHISSDGGSVTYGFMMFDAIRLYKGKIIGIVPGGQAISMASVILQACTLRKMSRHSWMNIHTALTKNPISYADIVSAGKMKKLTEVLKISTERILDAYMLRAKVSRKRIATLMGENKELPPGLALKLGLIDEII
ncbi:MAG TPA: ATP-dependent Clp protease proteolytic subunit [Candidatus Paceibacterota bacterium]|nr:ATP-dependent Clp protease proteolytic subunit [Candidatus Paceibacterota bacterium]